MINQQIKKIVDSQINFLNLNEIRSNGNLDYLSNPLISPLKKYINITPNILDGTNLSKSSVLNNLFFTLENDYDKNPINCLKLDSVNKRLITATSTGNITIFDTSTNLSFLKKVSSHQASVRSMCISSSDSNQNLLITGDSTGNIVVWDNQSHLKQKMKFTNAHEQAITDISFSINVNIIATSSEDNACKIVDINAEKPIMTYSEHNAEVKSCDWAKPRSLLATCGKDKKLRFFDPRLKESVAIIYDIHKDTVNRVRFHSNSNLLISGGKDHIVKLTDFRMLKVIQQFNNHELGVNSLAWHPFQNNSFCSVGEDGKLIFCEMGTEDFVQVSNAHDKEIFDICFNNLGNFVVTGGKDCCVKIWNRK